MDKLKEIIKNKRILILIAFLCLIGVVGGTFAYYKGKNVVPNGFTTGVYSSYVKKEFVSPENWQPGDVTPNVVNVTNEGNVDMAVRAKITEEWISSDGETILSGERNDEKLALYEIANEEWLYGMDRYYYYTKPLAPGETTLNLMETVTFNPNFNYEEGIDFECKNIDDGNGNVTQSCTSLSTGYSGATFKLTILIETIQLNHRWTYASFSDDLYEQIAYQGMSDENIDFNKTKVDTGVYAMSDTLDDTFPIYYYRGKVDNNHLIFAGFCWEIVRTTETGGVKLLYDGVPTDSGYCTNIGYDSMLRESPAFNNRRPDGSYTSSFSLQGIGYMYNSIYEHSGQSMVYGRGVLSSNWMYEDYESQRYYYFSDTVTYNTSTGKYTLDNPTLYTWTDGSAMKGKYTCLRQSEPHECWDVRYVVDVNDYEYNDTVVLYSTSLSNGKKIDDANMTISKSVIDNGDGTYTLKDPITFNKGQWYNRYNQYQNYYICYDGSTSCDLSNLQYILRSGIESYDYIEYQKKSYLYGNSFKYEDGKYQLVDAVKPETFNYDYGAIDNYHYTCLNTTGKCNKIKYIFYGDYSSVYYITLKNGESIEDAINKMLYDKDVNKINSSMKEYLEETWYKNNLLAYTPYLENTVYCNDRRITKLGGWDPNGGDVSEYLYFGTSDRNNYNKPTLECNQLDSFTLSVDAGGTKGYGNNKLKYPIGLLTYDEIILSGYSDSYLYNNGYSAISMTPYYAGGSDVYLYSNYRNSGTCEDCSSGYARPVVTLKYGLKISAGVGTEKEPYVVETNN